MKEWGRQGGRPQQAGWKQRHKKNGWTTALIQRMFGSKSIRKQMYSAYFLALFLPVAVLGTFLVVNTSNLLRNYYFDLVESDNLRVKTIFFEITTQIYNISENISSNSDITGIIGSDYPDDQLYERKADAFIDGNSFFYNYAEIEDLTIYSDNDTFHDYRIFKVADEEMQSSEWYTQAVNSSSVYWVPLERTDIYGNSYWNLCLVRRIPLMQSDHHAVLVIKISDNYLRTRIESSEYETVVGVDNNQIIYASDRSSYGEPMYLDIDDTDAHFSFKGDVTLDGNRYIADIVTLSMYQSQSRLYIGTLNADAYPNIHRIVTVCFFIILAAVAIPGGMIAVYTKYFTGRVDLLRNEMHKASHGDYNILADFRGQDELSEAFKDLQVMVEKIQEQDARMYQTQITERDLKNKQQEMEFKMLASQINPHFLYNTLETIRMKAFTANDREVANAIKLLGKSLRYVLENTGTASTTLKKELDYIENYVKIQRMRFGDRINYVLEIDGNIELEKYHILPLLLQPIVENAILHGLEQKEEDGRITVRVYLQEELHISISDNGCGMDAESIRKLRSSIMVRNPNMKSSIGLYNINQRIKLCYGSRYGLGISSVPGCGTTISLVIPANSDNLDEENEEM